MLTGLKSAATKKAMAIFESELSARVDEKIELFRNLTPADVSDDAKFSAVVIEPIWLYVRFQSGGAIGVLQKLVDFDIEQRFRKAMFHVRNELIVVHGGTVVLDPAFKERVGPVLIEAFKA